MKFGQKVGLVAIVAAMAAMPVAASQLTFFGEDLNNSESTPLAAFPAASAAEASFLANLIGVGTEDFEGFTTGDGVPLGLSFPGAGNATLDNGGGVIATVTPGSTNGFGRYATSGTNYWEVQAGGTNNFTVTFDSPVAAFGFYGIDIGDFGGRLTLAVTDASGTSNVIVPNTEGSSASTGGSVLFFGLIETDPSKVFTQVSFLTSTGAGDVFAFDDFTVGSLEQVNVIPLPASLPLVLAGMGAFGTMAWRRKRSA